MLMADAVLRKERVPLDANELAALVVVQAQDRLVELLLHHGLELRQRIEHFRLLPEEIDPEVARIVVNAQQPVAEAGGREYGQLVQVRVDALEERCGAVASTLREWVAVMLAANARLAVRRRWGVALDDESSSDLALDGLLEAICADVAEAAVPEGAAHHSLATLCGFGRGRRGGVQPGRVVVDGGGEAALAVLQEDHLLALDLNTEAVVRDEVENRKEIVLQRGDIQDAGQQHGSQRLIRRF
jgi:hypothetical protein